MGEDEYIDHDISSGGRDAPIRLDIDWNEVDLDAIELPEDDDMGIRSDDEEDEEEDLESETGFGNILVVDNLPVVPAEKFDKLQGVVRKIFSRSGAIRENGLWMPVDEATKLSRGYAFIEYGTPEEAYVTKEQTDGYKLDKNHVFKVISFDDFEKFGRVPDEWVPPETKEYTPKENLHWWLLDERARDQFVVRYGTETEVYWNDARIGKADPVYHRAVWTESFVQWSPTGSYLATVHRQGAALWGGNTWQRLMRFSHPQMKLLDFSPGERYLVTYSSHEPTNPRDTQKVTLNVWDVRSGKKLREFAGSADDFYAGGKGGGGASVAEVQWPIFYWCGDKQDKFFARLGRNAISVYETETMSLLDKKSIKADGVADFSWSPTDPIISMFTPESGGGNQPARVTLIAIPSRQELRQKNLFSVSECKMYWHSAGEYLAIRVDRYTKTKKSTYTGFELFRIKERDIPIEVLELENKNDKIIAFEWEPRGHRFALVHGDGPRPDVSFYSMKGAKVHLLTTLKGKQVNSLHWSPQGKFIVLAGLKSLNGQLEFFNVDDLETMAVGEHFMCTDIDWDPTGRFLATSVSAIQQMENGFNVWSFHGKLLYRLGRDRFFQFLWRPRPLSLLSVEREAEILKNLKKYSRRYEEEDELVRLQADTELMSERRQMLDEFRTRQARWRELFEEERPLRQELRDGEASDEEEYASEMVEVEEILTIQEEIVQ